MRRLVVSLVFTSLVAGIAPAVSGPLGDLQVEILSPRGNRLLTNLESSIQVEGGASIFGGVKHLDLFLVLDTSKSLQKTDPRDYRTIGAVGLVKSLAPRSDIQIGVVDFDRNADLIQPLTRDRNKVVKALRGLDQNGATDLAAGIRRALEGFQQRARPGSTRVMLLFTDGKSNAEEARAAMHEARRRGVAVHALLLGSSKKGTAILTEIARGTGASFIRVTNPAKLPEAFLNLRTTGIDRVTLSVNGSEPIRTRLAGGTFSAKVPLRLGENRIVATATSLDGRIRDDQISVVVSGPLALSIDTPLDGALFTERVGETEVQGVASLFAELAPELTEGQSDHGIDRVVLRVGDSPASVATLEGGRFRGRVNLREGSNRIVATATSRDGRISDAAVTVTVRPPGCGELLVTAVDRDGKPTLSISDRAVEIVFDASNSMWGQLHGRSKISIGKEILEDALSWLPPDLNVALRVYGHQHRREQRNCRDSELMVSFTANDPGSNRAAIRSALAGFKPRGQTPLGYSLEQIHADFGDFRGERAVVLVTDGIESCGGDPVAAARALRKRSNVPVHVISFGMGHGEDEDLAGLRAIAESSGGRFVTASSPEELRKALTVTIGTAFQVRKDGVAVADGALGSKERILLPPGGYTVHFDSAPPHQVQVELTSEESFTLLMRRRMGSVAHETSRGPAEYASCEDVRQPAASPRRRL